VEFFNIDHEVFYSEVKPKCLNRSALLAVVSLYNKFIPSVEDI